MNIKKSVVKSVQANGTYDSKQYGTFYKYEIAFENGDSGEYSSKSDNQNKFIQGQETYYTADQNQNGYWKIKPQNAEFAETVASKETSSSKPSTYTKFSREELIVRQNALGHAVAIWQGGALSVEDIEDKAEKLAAWVLMGAEEPNEKIAMLEKAGFKKEDDLPF